MRFQPRLSVVIPAFNEAKRLPASLTAISGFLGERSRWHPYEVIVVDDASRDATGEAARAVRLAAGRLRILRNARNRGKGGSVRRGVAAARGERVLFTDADLSTPIQALERLADAVDAGASVAIGSRAVPGAEMLARQPWQRETMGRIFNLLVQALALPGIWDSQCGFKLFAAAAARPVFADQTIPGFGFDVEILFLARRRGLTVEEVPVPWRNSLPSRVSPLRDAWRMLLDLFRIRWRHRRRGRRARAGRPGER